MADVFISYSRNDAATARRFADAFEALRYSVWWDDALRSGEAFDEKIEQALKAAKAVVVLWSKTSVVSRWVRAEATLADRNKTLVPVMIEPCERPIMFELTQTAELAHWQGATDDKAWLAFLADVQRFVKKRAKPRQAPSPEAPPKPPARSPKGERGGRPSLAILPFTNRSGERADDVFAGGMVEDIIAALSLGRGIKVIAQSATYAYRKDFSDLRTIGLELGARYLMEGNVRRVGDSLRVTAQLVEAENGAILWTQKFDRPLAELASLEEDLVLEVASHLGVQVQRIEMERALRKPGDLTAWEAIIRSWAAYARFTDDGIQFAIAEARRAVALAPDYAVAHATLAMALMVSHATSGRSDEALIRGALDHAERALELNANNATVLFQVAYVMNGGGRWQEALQYAQRAVDLNPNLPGARTALAQVLARINRFDEAIAQLDEGDKLAPRGFNLFNSLGMRCGVHYAAGRLDLALQAAEQSLTLNPNYNYSWLAKAVSLEELGRHEEARSAIGRLRKIEPNTTLDLWLARLSGSWMPPAAIATWNATLQKVWDETPVEEA